MRFSPDKCLGGCGLRTRRNINFSRFIEEASKGLVEPDGQIMTTMFWFESNACIQRALETYVDRRYHLDRDPFKDPHLPNTHIEEFIDNWNYQQKLQYRKAATSLAELVKDEHNAIVQQQREELAKAREKALAAENAQAEKDRRDANRQVIADQKDQERRLKEQTKEEAIRLKEEQEVQNWKERIRPKPIPPKLRFEHTHIIGPPGSGKTSLLEKMILTDLLMYPAHYSEKEQEEYNETKPSYVIIDPKGEMVKRLSWIEHFICDEWFPDRIAIIDPFQQPALNIFKSGNMASHFAYIFSTANMALTGRQNTCFTYATELLYRVPGADLFTLLDLLEDQEPIGRNQRKPPDPRFQQAIGSLTDPAIKRFFATDYYNGNYDSTRNEIKTRLWEVLKNKHLAAMFNAPENRLNIADCISKRHIILVNTRMIEMDEAHQVLGRYIISQFVTAVQRRGGTNPKTWHPAYLVVDEFQEFADAERTPRMLRLIREYKGGAVIAHHTMFNDAFNDDMRSAISGSTAIKYCSKPNGIDLSYMARDLGCDPEFLSKCTHTGTMGRFACTFTGLDHPFIHQIPFGETNTWPKMTKEEHDTLLWENRQRLCMPRKKPEPPEPPKEAAAVKQQMNELSLRDTEAPLPNKPKWT